MNAFEKGKRFAIKALRWALAFVDRNKLLLDEVCAMLLALVPIFQHYIGLIDNFGTTFLVLLVPYVALRVLPQLRDFRLEKVRLLLPLMMFFVFKMVAHGTTFFEVAQVLLVCGYLLAVSLGCIDVRSLTRMASIVAGAAGLCVLAQYFCYYILDFHLQLAAVPLLLPESEQWVLVVQTGLADINGRMGSLYRPAAFFLEPSHLFMYSFPVLFINLFAPRAGKWNWCAAILTTIGMVLSTSGMGIIVAGGAWGIFLALWNEKDGSFSLWNILRRNNLIRIGVLLVLVIVAMFTVPFVRDSVVRIFSNATGSSAISGRTARAINLLKKMTAVQWIIGTSDNLNGITFNMPGFMATAYKYGIVGLVLSYFFYVRGLFKLDAPYFWYTVILLVVSFFSAHTHGTFYMLYYVFLLMEGHRVNTGEWIGELRDMFKKPTTNN